MEDKSTITRRLAEYDRTISQKYGRIAGIDEAGRGPLAGPVCVAIVSMPLDEDKLIIGVNDSKKVTEKNREKLYEEIVSIANFYHVELIDEKVIDAVNILNATKVGMINCVDAARDKIDVVLIDAVKIDTDIPQINIIKGDATSYNIACASILAKVTRDRIMLQLDQKYPQYHFAKHKGYGTKEHILALKKYGKCEAHRNTFIGHFVGEK